MTPALEYSLDDRGPGMIPNTRPSAALLACQARSMRSPVESRKVTERTSTTSPVKPTDHSSASSASTTGTVELADRTHADRGSVGLHPAPEGLKV